MGEQPKDQMTKGSKGRGGKRPGAGGVKGHKSQKTLERAEALRQFRERVAKNTHQLLNSQMALASGLNLLFRVDKDAKGHDKPAVQVVNAEEIKAYIDGETSDSYYFITTKQPDNRALDSLLDRTYGKSDSNVNLNNPDGNLRPQGSEEKAALFAEWLKNRED